ncbi:MAG: Gldg family protein [Bauldia sp.]
MLGVARRELGAYFATPIAYVFIVAFLAASGAATFYVGDFLERRQADLRPFFDFVPWLFLVLIPAVGMRLWAEERRYGTFELLMTQPITAGQAVVGKFLAAWAFVTIAIALTFPIWITVNYLGDPDNGVIIGGYVATILTAGALIAAVACVSALTSNPVVAFVYGAAVSFLLMLSGLDLVLNLFTGWAPRYLVDLIASFSLVTHFDAMASGAVEARSIIFLLTLIVLFLFLNRLAISASPRFSARAAFLSVALFLTTNLVVALTLGGIRADLTEDRIYTVSPATRAVLTSLDEPVTLRFYLSTPLVNDVPTLRPYTERVSELLRSYERISNGMVRFEQIDPQPFSVDEDKAIALGLVGFNLSRAGERGYIGLVGTNALDQLEVIEALQPTREPYLEYDLTRAVVRLARPTEPIVGVIDGLGIFGSSALNRQPSAIIERLGADFELRQIPPDITAIPDDVDALVLVHPHALTPSALYAIDQYVIRGGSLLAFVDPLSEHGPADPNNPAVPQYPDSYLEPLLAAWGVDMAVDRVVGDLDLAIEVRAQAGNQIVVTDYPPWLIVRPAQFNQDDPVTAQLQLMRISSAGSLRPIAGATTTFSPLIVSSANSMLLDQATLIRRANPTALVDEFVAGGAPLAMAARITGQVSTAFPEGAPPVPAPGPDEQPPPDPPELIARSEGPISVIIVADTDLLADDVNIDDTGASITQNADFVINALDNLTNGGELIALRGRGVSLRPFTTLDAIEAAAAERNRSIEAQLQAELAETEAQLATVRGQALTPDGQIAALTPQQRETVDAFNQRILEVREELRDVRADLRSEIDAIGNRLRLINILAAPVLVILLGLGVALWQRLRVARHLGRRKALERQEAESVA